MATSMYDAYKDSNDVKRMKSVNLDRKLSSTTAHVPKRSTVVESPSGKVAKSSGPSQPPSTSKVLPAVPLLPTNPSNQSYQGSVHHPQPVRPASSAFSARPMSQSIPPNSMGSMGSSSRDESPSGIPSSGSSDQDGPSSTVTSVIRPSFARNNTSVRIVTEPSTETPVDQTPSQIDPHALEEEFEEQLTLRNLPEIIEAEQARVEHRPSVTSDRKLIANLTPVQSLVIKYFAVIQLQKSPLAETFDLDEILDLVSKKNNFWNKLFKGGKEKKDKKEIKKKGQSLSSCSALASEHLLTMSCFSRSSTSGSVWLSTRPARGARRVRLCARRDRGPSQGADVRRGHHLGHEANG